MKVIKARVLGWCMGVRRAVEKAQNSLTENSDEKNKKGVFTLGPLIHNPSVLSSLEEKGLKVIENPDELKNPSSSSVIIRAHGTTPFVVKNLEELGVQIIDATCPKVTASQNRARIWSSKGYKIYIAGDRNHGEVIGIASHSENGAIVIENENEALNLEIDKKSVLLAQTTFSPSEFEKIASVFKKKNPDVKIFNSICSATMERQKALDELEGKVDGIIVIGGRNSANTKRLYEKALKLCSYACLIEKTDEIPEDFFKLKRVGLTAGASTPDSVINEVESLLLKL